MSGLRGRVDTSQFRALAGKSSQLEPKLKAQLRRQIRQAAQVAANAAKAKVIASPVKGETSTGLRSDIAAGIRVTLMTGKTAGVVIRSAGGNQAHPPSVVKAFDSAKGWRHPVYGSSTYVQQAGHPYFASTISKHRDDVTRAVTQAMRDAANTLK